MNAETSQDTQMIHLTIDGQSITVPKGTTVFNAAKQAGINIPIFCYQDRMPPFGACRVCLVEVEKMPKLQTSCTLEATEGMVVKTQSKMAAEGRQSILEFLLINHPLDCPICDRGGECPLQDQAINYGPGLSRFFEEKRHFKKPIPLGPVLMLDRERCIICARCTRFGEIMAGDHALELIDRGYKTEVGTPDGGPAESKFIGNTIMICPVGALTSDVYRFRARPWDNEATNSACTLCPVGCSFILDSRDGEIVRTRSCENREINDIWLCDKGWFGYEFVDHPYRLKKPMIRKNGKLEIASWKEALELIVDKIEMFKSDGRLAGWGGDPLTVEENYLFQKLMREGCGVQHVDHRVGRPIFSLEDEGLAPGMESSFNDCENLSYAIFFGLDLTEEFPVLWLRLKPAIDRGTKVIFVGHYAPEIAPHLAKTVLHAPGQEISAIRNQIQEMRNYAQSDKPGAIFVGRQYLFQPQRKAILSELMKFKESFPHIKMNIMEGHCNSQGARFAGMRPDIGPMEQPLSKPGFDIVKVLQEGAQKGWDFLYVAGANPALKYPSAIWKKMREKLQFLVVQDLFLHETAQQADVVLPTLSFIEKNGSFITISGEVQQLLPGKDIPESIYSDGVIFTLLGEKLGLELALAENFMDKLRHLPKNKYETLSAKEFREERKTELAATFAPALFDHGVRMKHNPHAVWLAKEPKARLHPQEGVKKGIKDGDAIKITSNGASISATVKLDDKVAMGTTVLPMGFEELPVHELGLQLFNGIPIEIKEHHG